MTTVTNTSKSPRGWQRILFRLPLWLYRLGLGWLLGNRFLLLEHTGRKSGLPRQTVVEVAAHNAAQNSYLIASGWGAQADWYRNLRKTPQVAVQVGRHRMEAIATLLSPDESGQAMVEYAQHHPQLARRLARLIGHPVDGSVEAYRELGRKAIQFVRLTPHADEPQTDANRAF